MALRNEYKGKRKHLVTMLCVVVFVCLMAWATNTEEYLYLTVGEGYVLDWRVASYVFVCGGVLSLVSEVLLAVWVYHLYVGQGAEKTFFYSFAIWTLTAGVMFVLSGSVYHSAEGEYLSSMTLPLWAEMTMLSFVTPKKKVRLFSRHVKMWQLSLLGSLLILTPSLFNAHVTSVINTLSVLLISVVAGRIWHSIKKESAASVEEDNEELYASILHKNEEQRRLDAILDKISRVGYHRLSRGEKEFLKSISTKK